MAVLLDGLATAKAIRRDIKQQVEALIARTGVRPHLAAILAGDNPASQTYVSMKERACAQAGIISTTYPFAADALQSEVETTLAMLNGDPEIHGILIQHPLPAGMDEAAVLEQLDPAKDVDGIAPASMGRLLAGMDAFHACTPEGMMELMRRYDLPIAGKHAVVIGRSVILGKPMAVLLLDANATVTICHSRTPDLGMFTRQADILVAAVGRPELITGDMLKPGAVVLDAGYNRVPGRGHGRGRRGVRERGCRSVGDHARAGRGRPDDDCDAAAKYAHGGDPRGGAVGVRGPPPILPLAARGGAF